MKFGQPIPARGHMPFPGFRTQREVRQDEERRQLRRSEIKRRTIEEQQSRETCPYCGVRKEHGCRHQAAVA